ncbi:MAG: DNA-binding LytR/AlgR family response regulator [Saprospiraceae bacterium]|jgi:DNA-binding LytR/AlgR family response regulator
MIKYIIVDDEHLAHKVIKGYCDMLPNMEFLTSCYDAFEAIEYLNNHNVDLIFLDLNMPKLSGFQFLKTLTYAPKVIVTTAYSEFALEGYELNVIDYLLKPFSFERFIKAINKTQSTSTLEKSIRTTTIVTEKDERIFLKGDNKIVQVKVHDILYLEASGNYTKVILNDNSILTREKISGLLDTLPKSEFIQVHKSFAVAKNHIDSIQGNRISIGTHIIPIGKVYKMNLNDLFS